jgi:hypothetical protein
MESHCVPITAWASLGAEPGKFRDPNPTQFDRLLQEVGCWLLRALGKYCPDLDDLQY